MRTADNHKRPSQQQRQKFTPRQKELLNELAKLLAAELMKEQKGASGGE